MQMQNLLRIENSVYNYIFSPVGFGINGRINCTASVRSYFLYDVIHLKPKAENDIPNMLSFKKKKKKML